LLNYDNMNKILVENLVDILIFLEFTDEKLLNLDTSVEMQERISLLLQGLLKEEKKHLLYLLKENTKNYESEKLKNYILSLPETLGLQ